MVARDVETAVGDARVINYDEVAESPRLHELATDPRRSQDERGKETRKEQATELTERGRDAWVCLYMHFSK